VHIYKDYFYGIRGVKLYILCWPIMAKINGFIVWKIVFYLNLDYADGLSTMPNRNLFVISN
jgi:hypothetical protein